MSNYFNIIELAVLTSLGIIGISQYLRQSSESYISDLRVLVLQKEAQHRNWRKPSQYQDLVRYIVEAEIKSYSAVPVFLLSFLSGVGLFIVLSDSILLNYVLPKIPENFLKFFLGLRHDLGMIFFYCYISLICLLCFLSLLSGYASKLYLLKYKKMHNEFLSVIRFMEEQCAETGDTQIGSST